jgi:hypothetical protein
MVQRSYAETDPETHRRACTYQIQNKQEMSPNDKRKEETSETPQLL